MTPKYKYVFQHHLLFASSSYLYYTDWITVDTEMFVIEVYKVFAFKNYLWKSYICWSDSTKTKASLWNTKKNYRSDTERKITLVSLWYPSFFLTAPIFYQPLPFYGKNLTSYPLFRKISKTHISCPKRGESRNYVSPWFRNKSYQSRLSIILS